MCLYLCPADPGMCQTHAVLQRIIFHVRKKDPMSTLAPKYSITKSPLILLPLYELKILLRCNFYTSLHFALEGARAQLQHATVRCKPFTTFEGE